ncbi:MAG TPA: pyridoxamine 5'-phosphate oxidase family protein [Polyangiaceae bacterium]|nr:pyridoxamine 5'-phosphate oxidase family protein [Polyangiaceae bacterium]
MSHPPDVRPLVDLAGRARLGSLATIARQPAGWPFATLVAVAFDGRGRPLLRLSRLAEHTKNLEACSRASLLVVEPSSERDDPLALGRMTLVGACEPVPAPEAQPAHAAFAAAHPEAAAYASLADFGMWRLEVDAVRWVGGFGRMNWVPGDAYARACAARAR